MLQQVVLGINGLHHLRVTVANTHGHNTCKGLGVEGSKGWGVQGGEREGRRCHWEQRKGEKGIIG